MARDHSPRGLHAREHEPLVLAAQGSLWTGGRRESTGSGTFVHGQTYVEYWVPEDLRFETPLVFVHGGGGQGLDYLVTADGREGWAKYFLRHGFAVYVIDRPGHGRAPFYPEVDGELGPSGPSEMFSALFTAPAGFPSAELHDKWPGSGVSGDAIFDGLMASMGPSPADLPQHHADAQRGSAELLDEIGRAILLTHSAGGPTGWLVADARPDLVAGIVAVEPLGPPFADTPMGELDWGLAAAALTHSPAPASAEQLREETLAKKEPRTLVNLQPVPVLVVTAEASLFTEIDPLTVAFLSDAGVSAEHIKLTDAGLHGNGHLAMHEVNSDDVASVLEPWIAAHAERI
jgi:pimeloyl-ACP methyl ester carboxylesterase